MVTERWLTKRRAAWLKKLESGRRPGRAVSIHCRKESRPCVIHDLPGSCGECERGRAYAAAGIRSMMDVVNTVRS